MCTTEQRDEIYAEILVAHTGMPRGYAAWFLRQLSDGDRLFATRAAIAGRKSLVRELQRSVHERRAWNKGFPANIVREIPTDPDRPRRKRRRRRNPAQLEFFPF